MHIPTVGDEFILKQPLEITTSNEKLALVLNNKLKGYERCKSCKSLLVTRPYSLFKSSYDGTINVYVSSCSSDKHNELHGFITKGKYKISHSYKNFNTRKAIIPKGTVLKLIRINIRKGGKFSHQFASLHFKIESNIGIKNIIITLTPDEFNKALLKPNIDKTQVSQEPVQVGTIQ